MNLNHRHLDFELSRFNAELPVEKALTPPDTWYTDPQFFELEQQTLFRDYWQIVGRIDQVDRIGAYFTGKFINWPYVVVRDEDEVIKAFFDVCSHHGTCVSKGQGVTKELVCPYHGWTYALNGSLVKAPRAGNIRQHTARGLDLKPLPVKTWGPFIAVHFGDQQEELPAPDFHDQFTSHLFDGLNFIKRITYKIPCNWKVFVDNYLDGGYHVPHMHKDLSEHLNMASYRTEMGNTFSVQRCEGVSESAPSAPCKDRLGQEAYYAWLCPNFMINRYGGWMDTNLVVPMDSNHCLTIFDYFYEGSIQQEQLDAALEASEKVQNEDMDICSMVWDGLNSGAYNQGVYAPRFEEPMYQFHKLLAKSLKQNHEPKKTMGFKR